MKHWLRRTLAIAVLFLPAPAATAADGQDRPNILWLSFEDTSATNFGCYGNAAVNTPVVDGLARRGILFERVSSVAPHCSPARSTLISGSSATTYGTDIHRHAWQVPEGQYFFPPLLRRAGYYCTNNAKTDYNARGGDKLLRAVWDGSGHTAGYNSPQRKPGQPFFAVFNNGTTHMTRVHTFHTEGRRTPEVDPAKVALPPFVPDIPDVRADYALHLEGAQDIDKWVQTFLDDLAHRGLADDTIVFVFGDHGGVLPRGKAFPYESGLRPPLVVYVPPKWQKLTGIKPGTRSPGLVGFEDFAPTVLTLAGVDVPAHMQGHSFLAPGSQPKPIQFSFRTNTGQHFDPIRTASDGHYKYIRSFTPYKPLGLRQGYQWAVPGQMAWDRMYHEGKCAPEHRGFFEPKPVEQLFDLQTDPWEMKDLAADPGQRDRLEQFRSAVAANMRRTKDLGLFPRSMRDKGNGVALYDWVRKTDFPVDELIAAAELASTADAKDVPRLVAHLKSDRPELRFWAASGFVTGGAAGRIKDVPPELAAAARDANDEIAATAAEALCRLGQAEAGLPVLMALLRDGSNAAASSLEELGPVAKPLVPQLKEVRNKQPVRSILINFGELPFDEYYGPRSHAQGLAQNARRPEWRYPSPDPAANAKRPAEQDAAD
jgi:arylsulfatase A-like enzyme